MQFFQTRTISDTAAPADAGRTSNTVRKKNRCDALLLKLICVLLAGVLLGFGLICAIYCIPTGHIRKNAAVSAEQFREDGVYHYLAAHAQSTIVDGFSDVIMMSTAAYSRNESVLEKAVCVPWLLLPGANSSEYDDSLQVAADDASIGVRTDYGRYWHGYLVMLKPLMFFFSYQQLRLINYGVQFALVFLITLLLAGKRRMSYCAFALCISMFFYGPITSFLCLHYATVFYIIACGLLLMALFHERFMRLDAYPFVFLLLGMITSYMDLLTSPINTLGIPLAFYYCLTPAKGFKKDLACMIRFGCCWALGYFGMWIGKFLIISLYGRLDLISGATDAAMLHLGAHAGRSIIAYFSLVARQFSLFRNEFYAVVALVALTVSAIGFNRARRSKQPLSECGKKDGLLPQNGIFLLIGLLPFLWWGVLISQSGHLFTSKALATFIFALLCFFGRRPQNETPQADMQPAAKEPAN